MCIIVAGQCRQERMVKLPKALCRRVPVVSSLQPLLSSPDRDRGAVKAVRTGLGRLEIKEYFHPLSAGGTNSFLVLYTEEIKK